MFTELFVDAPIAAQVFYILQLAFSVWMMVDAYHRRVETFWYWIIFMFQPAGAWVYFFAVKFRTMRLHGARGNLHTGEPKLSLDELRFRVDRSPTVANRFALAEGLMEKGKHADAIPLLEAVLAVEADYCSVLHALAKCRLATNDAERALAPLERLMKRDPRWALYSAWGTLITVQQALGKPAEALATCRELEKRQPTLKNKCLLAEHLLGNNKPSEAIELLGHALAEHRFTPWITRWHNRRHAREARLLLAQAENVEKTG